MQLTGIPVSKGIALAPAYKYQPAKLQILPAYIKDEQISAELLRYGEVKAQAKQELTGLQEQFSKEDAGHAAIFNAHIEILQDVALDEEVTRLIEKERYSLEFALETAYAQFIELLSSVDDPVLKERCADLEDVKERVLYACLGEKKQTLAQISEPSILFAHDLFPSDTATLDREKVIGIVTEIGGTTSHSAILARSFSIPAVLGVIGALASVSQGEEVAIDGESGDVLIAPNPAQRTEFLEKQAAYQKAAASLQKYLPVEPVTKDGVRVDVCLNIGSAEDSELTGAPYADGVGLFRSEFLYMAGNELPSEEAQFQAYKKAAATFGNRQMIIRTLDIGGDKSLACMDLPKEDNPFLGCRALRLCFQERDLFKTQLRAMLRASAFGNLAIMFPMVGSMEDIRTAKAHLEEAKAELRQEGLPFNEAIMVGIMIEIPAIALIADMVAKEVDFASIGTNDLCQYLLAVDRLNPNVSSYYQSYHPAMFRLIGQTADAFAREGKVLSVCGEMGGDPYAAAVLIGLGIRKLSMSFSSMASIKKLITTIEITQTEAIAKTAMQKKEADEVYAFLKETLGTDY